MEFDERMESDKDSKINCEKHGKQPTHILINKEKAVAIGCKECFQGIYGSKGREEEIKDKTFIKI